MTHSFEMQNMCFCISRHGFTEPKQLTCLLLPNYIYQEVMFGVVLLCLYVCDRDNFKINAQIFIKSFVWVRIWPNEDVVKVWDRSGSYAGYKKFLKSQFNVQSNLLEQPPAQATTCKEQPPWRTTKAFYINLNLRRATTCNQQPPFLCPTGPLNQLRATTAFIQKIALCVKIKEFRITSPIIHISMYLI